MNDNLQHCTKCEMCYTEKAFKIHSCNANKDNIFHCQICMENINNNTKIYYHLLCDHKIHCECYDQYKKHCKKNNKELNCCMCQLLILLHIY
jgi:RING finger/CHY zinc finger protein 1